jgi:hypothetical protein
VTARGYRVPARGYPLPRVPARGYRVPFTRFTRAGGLFTRAGALLPRAVTASSLRGCRGRRFEIENCGFPPIPRYQLATTRRGRVARLFQDRGAGLSPCAGTPLLKRPVGTSGAASMQDTPAARTPKEPHAQRSWHLQWSLPAQSEDLRTEVWLAESLRRRAARPTPRSHWHLATTTFVR